jgi:nitroreductase
MEKTKSFDELVRERRSVRKYSDRRVERQKINLMLEALRLAPSACNAQPWRIIVVDDAQLKDTLVEKGLGVAVPNSWAKTAPVIIAACSDLSFFTHRVGEKVQGVQYHLIDMGIALEHLVLKAVELGLGTCYIGWFKRKPVKKILNIPSSWNVDCLLTLGYPESVPEPSPRKNTEEITFFNGKR